MTTQTLEFTSPSSNKLVVNLFNARSHRTTNKSATRQQLQDAYDNGLPDLEEGNYTKMIKYENTEDWLEPCLLENEEENDKNVVLIMEEKIHMQNPEGKRWLKVAIYDSIRNCYLLRSITNIVDNNNSSSNYNLQSKNNNWYICLATIGTDIEFFNELRRVLELN